MRHENLERVVILESWAFYHQSFTNHLTTQSLIPTSTKFSKLRYPQKVSSEGKYYRRIRSKNLHQWLCINCGVGSGIFSYDLTISLFFCLADEYKVGCQLLNNRSICGNIEIFLALPHHY